MKLEIKEEPSDESVTVKPEPSEPSTSSKLTPVNKVKSEPSESAAETCPICLCTFGNKDIIGKPNVCAHKFCVECIQEWSKVSILFLEYKKISKRL